jgi:hypothetical protein
VATEPQSDERDRRPATHVTGPSMAKFIESLFTSTYERPVFVPLVQESIPGAEVKQDIQLGVVIVSAQIKHCKAKVEWDELDVVMGAGMSGATFLMQGWALDMSAASHWSSRWTWRSGRRMQTGSTKTASPRRSSSGDRAMSPGHTWLRAERSQPFFASPAADLPHTPW